MEKKKKLNLDINGIHMLNSYKIVVSHLKLISVVCFIDPEKPQRGVVNYVCVYVIYPARFCGCFAVHTVTGRCFCTITLYIQLVPFSHLVRIPDEVCLIRRNRPDNKQS